MPAHPAHYILEIDVMVRTVHIGAVTESYMVRMIHIGAATGLKIDPTVHIYIYIYIYIKYIYI